MLFKTDCIAGHCGDVAGDRAIFAPPLFGGDCNDGVCNVTAAVGVKVMVVPAGKLVAG